MGKVIGYIRVSTKDQAEKGGSLNTQAAAIRDFCRERGFDLTAIEEDDCTAAGSTGHMFRDGLKEALRKAKADNLPLVVPSVDRLGRHPAVLQEIFDAGVPVFSVSHRRRLGRDALEGLVDQAMARHNELINRIREGMGRAKARGTKMGNPTNLPQAQRNGAIANGLRADQKAREIADFMDTVPDWDVMTHREKAELLNARGPKNLISAKRGERKDWTPASLRKPLKHAEQLKKFEEGLESIPDGQMHMGGPNSKNSLQIDPRTRDQMELDEFYKDNPLYGMF